MKIYIPIVLDCAFSAFIAFILSLVIFSYFVSAPYAAVISFTIAALTALFSFKIISKKNKKEQLKDQEKQELKLMTTQFNFSTPAENNEFFYRVFCAMGYAVERKKGGIFFKDCPAVVFIKFGFADVTKAEVVKIFNLLKNEDIGYIISENFSQELKDFIARFNGRLVAVSEQEIYKFLKEKNRLPEIKYSFTENKKKGLKLLKNLLYKNKAKNYLVFGLVFLLMSYFFPYKLYYVIVGVIFLCASLLSRLFGISSEK
jgi:membrane protein implicated in regulation of membrane protease activity